ncbi:sugar phosphate isomerase/epimerase family protein [Coraliomargarita akajimensis]|uniref:Xylose isomerase domain protein TIM barrel n=1 Tax=Coraliomargarita akajimensis (strain DSM 45221 / IAM 15411 / JCM 23193 / KCTC 12865 / 04OKA010-24) TaxID=583355 RepID=D5EQY7_CORAD|nr:sugar phosphate isomerase/epimerase family protein [Coraliomargarita akajimensis]ADE53980.1 Xylose isomerase domain protein TIM barrel [Coraliomargarita akajimensis DSM 45221]
MIKIGCFALVNPFSPLDAQFQAIRELGFDYADLTDSHDGALLGNEFGFTAAASLDAHPSRVKAMVEKHQLSLTAVCAHANLLDATAPDVYGTAQIIKAIRLARDLGVKQVITTEGDAKTEFGENLSYEERIFSIVEKLYWPVKWAEELGIELLIEPHGIVTDNVEATAELLERLGHPDTVGLNLDTGNLWLGGGDNFEYIERFADRIKHVHWKDLDAEWEPKRGKQFGCGMGLIALGDGVIGLPEIAGELKQRGFDGPTTLEVFGADAVKTSAERLQQWFS